MLVFLGSHQSSDIILDRILPFVIHFLKSRVAVVRVAAIHSVVSILQHVTTVPPSDANTFPEYVLPLLLPLCQDPATAVRAALAQQLATIAELAVKFLDLVTLGGPGATTAESSPLIRLRNMTATSLSKQRPRSHSTPILCPDAVSRLTWSTQ